MKKQLEQWLIIPDVHAPYEDKRAFNMMLGIAQQEKIKNVCILGDFADFYAVSSHGRAANQESMLKKEITEVNKRLREIESICDGKKIFLSGNHENRLERFINNKAPELFGLVDIPELLQLNKWEYHSYRPTQLAQIGNSKLYARHTPLAGGTLPAHGSVVKAGCSVIFGHIHRDQHSHVVMANGDAHIGISVGWLGDKDHEVFDYVAGHHQWTLGFGIATIEPNGNFHIEAPRIIDYKCMANGTLYEG